MSQEPVEMKGSEMRVSTTPRLTMMASPFMALLGAAAIVFAYRGARGDAVWMSGGMGLLLLGSGLYFAFFRRGLVLDRDSRRVTAWWRWLFLRGERTVGAAGAGFRVERDSTHSNENGTTYFFRILLGDEVLHTISEDTGGRESARKLAQRMADHLGARFDGERDCPAMRRRDAIQAKYALAPLLVVLIAMFAGVAVLLLTTLR